VAPTARLPAAQLEPHPSRCARPRRTLHNYRSPLYLGSRTGDKLIVVLILMTLFANKARKGDLTSVQDTCGLLFLMTTLASFGASTFLCYIMMDRALFYRETDDGLYSVFTYLVTKVRGSVWVTACSCRCDFEGKLGVCASAWVKCCLVGLVAFQPFSNFVLHTLQQPYHYHHAAYCI
jgi:hypothetical protein